MKKKNSSPHWDEQFMILVTENSVLEFRIICKAKVFDDTIFGSKSAKISHWVKKESDNGKCKYNKKFILQLNKLVFLKSCLKNVI